MLIQNTGSIVQPQQSAKFATQSEFNVPASNAKAVANAPVELPNMAHGQAVERQPSSPQLKYAVDSINKFLQQSNRNIQFSVDADTQKTVVKLIDSDTGDVIRQYPSKDVLEISKSIESMQQGTLLKQRA
ncbi:MAG: flagellar protein FlaG [Gallionella sp.]|nr:flagellar protein FlaG [Gallionella sp.]